MISYRFRLFVTGETGRSRQAADNLRELCEAHVAGFYELEVIDVLDHPQRAEEDRVIATPTVIRLVPGPPKRVIGDLSDLGQAAIALDLPDTQSAAEAEGGGK
jgi:circadian clock protein KaiB